MAFENDFFKNSPLTQMGNDLSGNSPFNGGSIFSNNICGDFTTEASNSVIKDYPALVALLKSSSGHFFDYKDYTKEVPTSNFLPTPTSPLIYTSEEIPIMASDKTTVAAQAIDDPRCYVYYKEDGVQKKGCFESSLLNKRICYLDTVPSYSILVDPSSKTMSFTFSIYYENTQQYRQDIKTTEDNLETATINSKYRAIRLSTSSTSLFYGFIKEIGKDAGGEILRYIIKKFKNAYTLLNRKDLTQLQWFYDKTPNFILHTFSKEELWNDLKLLLQYDAASWIVDTSNHMIRIIQAIRAIDPSYLYTQFYADPKFIKDTYDHLGGESMSSEQGGQMVANKTIFASILLAVTYDYYQSQKKPLTSNINFTIDGTHRVNSNVLWGDNAETFTLKQEVIKKRKVYGRGSVSGEVDDWVQTSSESLHPLALVMLTTRGIDGKGTMTIACPAIWVKDMAYLAEWERIEFALRIGGDVVAIIFGIASLGTASPFLLALAIADIGIAGVDLAVQAFREQLEGTVLLKIWEQIYTIGGIAIAVASAPQLIKGILDAGGALLKTARGLSEVSKNFIKATLTKVILEINISRGIKIAENGVEIGGNVLKDIREVHFVPAAVDRLEEAGVIFARVTDEQGKIRYTAFYNGEELVAATDAKSLRDELKDVWNARKGRELEEALEELKVFAIERKVVKKIRDFVHKHKGPGLLAKLTQPEIAEAIRGFTKEADEIAEAIQKERITVEFWDDEFYYEYLIDNAKKAGMNDLEALQYAWETEAYTKGALTVFKESSDPLRFLIQVVHEGTHALDNRKILDWVQAGENLEEIKAAIGTTWVKEERAFLNEHEFQKAIKMDLDFKDIDEIRAFIRENYTDN